jgi:hypothetical protein
MNVLEYGKLIEQIGNKYIIQLNTTNVVIIQEIDGNNFVRFFRKGEFIFEFKDSKISENTFTRTISDIRFTFKNSKLTKTELLSTLGNIKFWPLTTYNDSDSILLKQNFNPLLILLLISIFWTEINDNLLDISYLAMIPFKNIIKLRKIGNKTIWNTLVFNVNNKVFSRNLLEKLFNKIWNKIENEFTNDNHMFILFKIKYNNGEISSIGKVQKLNKSDKISYLNWIIANMKIKSEYYNETQIESIIISYGFKEGKIIHKENSTNIKFIELNEMNLPVSINPMDFGNFVKTTDNGKTFILQNSKAQTITINKFENYNEVEYFADGKILIKFRDEITSENTFVRILDNKKYYFEDNQQILFVKEMKGKFIEKISKSKKLVNNFITLDIETYIKDSILIPYCISIYDGNKTTSFWLSEYKNVDNMILTALKSIMIRKYNGYNIYMHNMAKFDIIFLFKYLAQLGLVNPIIHNDRIILINFNFGKDNEYQLKFKDSYLILLHNLRKLCKSFDVKNSKSIFPHFFVNENNLDYIGRIPDFKFFDKINQNEYNDYKARFDNWNLKNEAIKYCELDCISLYQVIYKFNDMIFNLFNMNVHHYPTLPSLAFAIFRSNFMNNKENLIPQLFGKIADDIRKGYTGGSCDMFIPKSKSGIKIKCYDVNSLYPYIMQSKLMPVGFPTFFKGNIRKIDPNAFGFFFVKVIAPDNIKHPIIQTHIDTNDGKRTISPIGTWEDMIFSVEMDNAMKVGYHFEILWGYTFEKDYVFTEYVDFLYSLRLNYPPSDPMNFIAKILLNSLYGRFGMDDNFKEVNVIHKDYYTDFHNKFSNDILKVTEIDDYFLVEFKLNKDDNGNTTHNTDVAIAASITAYARVHMSQFKNNPKINLYYTDTDSIYTDSDIDESFIDSKVLGKLKLENICNKAIFLSPKVYCLETIDGKVVYKIKGLKHEVELTMNDFKKLLIKNSLIEKIQTKFIRKLSKGHIEVLEQLYTLQITDNKRKLIYDKNSKLVSTKAYKIDKSFKDNFSEIKYPPV